MASRSDDRFRVFISHKQDDHALAMVMHRALGSLSPRIECFVSGIDIASGAEWSSGIRAQLRGSHLLVLLFTEPSQGWDWCLFEAGVFSSRSADGVSSIICLHHPDGQTARPLTEFQGVPVEPGRIARFLAELCKETWRISAEWRQGAVAPRVRQAVLDQAVADIVDAFPPPPSAAHRYHPCHRVVLDLRDIDLAAEGIPDDARIMLGEDDTSSFTMSLFNVATSARVRTWRDLLEAADALDSPWRHQLDRRFVAALGQQLFAPMTATFRAWDDGRGRQRIYRPMLYDVVHGGHQGDERPVEVTIVFDPQLAPSRVGGAVFNLVRINARFSTEVIDEYAGRVRDRLRAERDVFAGIREALRLVYEEADAYAMFDPEALAEAYGDDLGPMAIIDIGRRWDATRATLAVALDERDVGAVEAALAELRSLNREFSVRSAERYLSELRAGS
jgi:TIR domain